MSGIGKADQIILQLRSQLRRVASQRSRPAKRTDRTDGRPLERLRAMEEGDGVGDQDLRRKFIRAILMEELGEEMANQPEFGRISDDVWALIEADEELQHQLGEALAQLRQS